MQIGEIHGEAQNKSESIPLTMYCKHCPYTLEIDQTKGNTSSSKLFNPCMYRSNYSSNHPLYYATLVNKYTFDDPTLPRMRMPCPNEKCPTQNDTSFASEVIFVRYDDQDMHYLYLCQHCRQCWHKDKKGGTVVLFDFSQDTA